jgi:para-aminobenzoate synthetase/4-amino-4-deoxychorismate lyase
LIDRGLQKAEYGVGGGIVWDSTSSDEYTEALLKASVLTEARQQFSLLETLLWSPTKGFFLREQHIARMLDSASYFNFPITKEDLEEYLKQVASTLGTTQRVRVLLDSHGILAYEAKAYQPSKNTRTLKVGLAKEAIDSKDIFLFHKTTQREVYESARRWLEGFDDVLLYNEKTELTEFTIGNMIVKLDGQFFTPPVSCGLLPGTFRAHLLATGQVQERTILRDELARCTRIFRVNSIRCWQNAEIQ